MAALLKLVDEDFGTPVDARRPAGELRLASQRVSARTIIAERVAQEVALINNSTRGGLANRSWIVPLDEQSPERTLNPLSLRRPGRRRDAASEIARACAAFEQRRFLLLVDDRQLDGLDDEIGVADGAEVLFLKLSPLKGG